MTHQGANGETLRIAAAGLAGVVAIAGFTGPACATPLDASDLDFRAPPARFADATRASRLAEAFPEIDRRMREFLARERVPGAAWGIVVDGRVVHLGVGGLRDVAAGEPVREDSVFRIASMTKSFTAMAILQLRDAGKLSLDDPVERHVPQMAGWRYPTSDSPRLTIRHLLTHAEGFPEDNPWGDQQLSLSEHEFDALLAKGVAFSNAPGLAYEYSNTGYAILGRVVAQVSGLPYPRYVEEHILKPLGMTATTFDPEAVAASRRTEGYRLEDDTWRLEPQLGDGAFGAMGGLLTSIADLGRFVALFLDAYPARDDADAGPLSRASLREMQQAWRARPITVTPAASPDGSVTGPRGIEPRLSPPIQLNAAAYGYGLRISQTCEFSHVVAHSGGLPGFGSQMRWLPEYGVGLLGLGNLTYTGWGVALDSALDVLRRTGALQARVPTPSPALLHARREVNGLLREWDDERAKMLAAMNLFLDRSLERRRNEFSTLGETLGDCRERDGFFTLENALRGEWILDCERGAALASVTLAPTLPPRVQHLELRAVDASRLTPPTACPTTRPVP